MKCKVALLLVAAFLFGAVSQAAAVEIKTKGQLVNVFGVRDGQSFVEDVNSDDFYTRTRLRLGLDIIASENLKGVVEWEIGHIFWGRNGDGVNNIGAPGGSLDTDGINVKTRYIYLDWLVPNTALQLKIGLQPLFLPAAVTAGGNPIMGGDVAAVTAAYKFSPEFNLTGFWARPYDRYETDASTLYQNRSSYDAMDMFGLIGMYNTKAVTFRPWAMYSSIGNESDFWRYRSAYRGPAIGTAAMDRLYTLSAPTVGGFQGDSDLWAGGIALRLAPFAMPLTFTLDAVYGDLNNEEGQADFSGWYTAARVEYKTSWGTPGVFSWYASGDDADAFKDKDYGRMPTISSDPGWTMLGLGATDTFPGAYNGAITSTGIGTWGVGLQIRDLSFTKDLYHLIRFAYYGGTNNSENIDELNTQGLLVGVGPTMRLGIMGENHYLTYKDRMFEVNLNSRYEFTQNLRLYVDLGYLRADFDDVWRTGMPNGNMRFERKDAWKAVMSLEYRF